MCLCNVPLPVWVHAVVEPQPAATLKHLLTHFLGLGQGRESEEQKWENLWVEMKTV